MCKHSATTSTHDFQNLSGRALTLKLHKYGNTLSISLGCKGKQSLFSPEIIPGVTTALLSSIACFLFHPSLIWYYAIVSILFIVYRLMTTVREENILMIKSLGYQLTTKYVLGQTIAFIPHEKVHNVFINEVILGHTVVHILTLLTEDSQVPGQKLTPLFLVSIELWNVVLVFIPN